MLNHILYFSAIWLILAFALALLFGTRWRWGNFFVSAIYLFAILGIGDVIALIFFPIPVEIMGATAIVIWLGVPLILLLHNWNAPGQSLFIFSLFATLAYLLYAFLITAFSPLSPIAFVFSFLLLVLEFCSLSLAMTYAFEVLDVLSRIHWHRIPKPLGPSGILPMVSLHVPAYNEPVELVEQTLRALAKLDYPRYEVILVDNNTPKEESWQPLVKVCRELGFKCLHLDHWPGYKSGALNFALAMTDPKAEIVGVVDADYIVEPRFLKETVPYFVNDPKLAFVQCPQDYRNARTSKFFQAAYDTYKYFFALSMPARNERNAIIFCGTMGLLRKRVLQEIGGWDEWCITEDAEASLRILNRGYTSLYINRTFGRGLMPLDFEGLKKQRFRWAFGGVQIIKKHWGKLMPWSHLVDPANRMMPSQRYFYFVAGIQWFNELFTFVFTIMVIVSALVTLAGQTGLLRPTSGALVILVIVLIGMNMFRALWGLRYAMRLSWIRAFRALTMWFSLTWVVALACVQAVVRTKGVFLRTPKSGTKLAWLHALQITSWETLLAIMCVLTGVGAVLRLPSFLSFALFMICCSQAIIYFSAPSQSLLSVATVGGSRFVQSDRSQIGGDYVTENRLGFQIGLAIIAFLIGAFFAALWPAPNLSPWWSNFSPQPIIVPQPLPRNPPGQQKKQGEIFIPTAAAIAPRVSATPTASATATRPITTSSMVPRTLTATACLSSTATHTASESQTPTPGPPRTLTLGPSPVC
jgi:cellulose synthase/poly-beta-1,6-N-acetylglucosamine synthase-like glycosyltransferase